MRVLIELLFLTDNGIFLLLSPNYLACKLCCVTSCSNVKDVVQVMTVRYLPYSFKKCSIVYWLHEIPEIKQSSNGEHFININNVIICFL